MKRKTTKEILAESLQELAEKKSIEKIMSHFGTYPFIRELAFLPDAVK